MLIQAYETFLAERKAEWLNKKAKDKEAKPELKADADERYNSALWLGKAIKNARYSITTHTSTFTHPDAKATALLFQKDQSINGYLSSNNVRAKQKVDVFGNAATDGVVNDTYLFLVRQLEDGKTVWEHFEDETEEAKGFIEYLGHNFGLAKENLGKIFIKPQQPRTSGLVKQVYFPAGEENYHLLSILTPAAIVIELFTRINAYRFNEQAKEARLYRKNNAFCTEGFADFLNLTEIKFGGSKPQNISVLNSQNAGRAYLLPSMPPRLEKRAIRLPSTDFFIQCIYRKNFKDSFVQLHQLMQLDLNNMHIHTGISNIIRFLIDQILLQAFKIRKTYEAGWSHESYYSSLPKVQRLWLDSLYEQHRQQDDEWRKEISSEISHWILKSYEKTIQSNYKLGAEEILAVKQQVVQALQQDKEFF